MEALLSREPVNYINRFPPPGELLWQGPALQYRTALSMTWTGEPASICALPRATSQPSARSRRATTRLVGEAFELAGGNNEKAITLELPLLSMRVRAALRRA
jgi:hypothetical protein